MRTLINSTEISQKESDRERECSSASRMNHHSRLFSKGAGERQITQNTAEYLGEMYSKTLTFSNYADANLKKFECAREEEYAGRRRVNKAFCSPVVWGERSQHHWLYCHMILLLRRVIPILTTTPNAFSPVPCDQPAPSHNPSLSWFLITLAVRTDKGQSQPAPGSLTHCVRAEHRMAAAPVCLANPGFFTFGCVTFIYRERNMSRGPYANTCICIFTRSA